MAFLRRVTSSAVFLVPPAQREPGPAEGPAHGETADAPLSGAAGRSYVDAAELRALRARPVQPLRSGAAESLVHDLPNHRERIDSMARTLRSKRPGKKAKKRGGGRPQKHTLALGHNVTDQTCRDYRDTLKAAKEAGVDPDAIIWALGARRREIEDVERDLRWQARMAAIAGLAI